MKIVKRVSLLKSIQRINDPAPVEFKVTRMTRNDLGPYRLTNKQELYRFGYHNFSHKPWLITAAGLAFMLGFIWDSTQKALMDNQRETLYRNRLKERQHSGFWLGIKIIATKFSNDLIAGNLFPFHQIISSFFNIDLLINEEKNIRFQQHKYFTKNRSSKYDFLELGVLEKFPYPNQPTDNQKPNE